MPPISSFKSYQRALAQWPKDALRPEVSFSKAMQSRIERRYAPNYGTSGSTKPQVADAPQMFDEKVELEQVNALYSFLENRYSRKYPLSENLMKPRSNPRYYENVKKELEEAPKRSWLGRIINSWKGSLRMA